MTGYIVLGIIVLGVVVAMYLVFRNERKSTKHH